MDKEKLFKIVTKILIDIQKMSGHEVSEITPKTVPIGDLHGFDSMTGLEFSIMLPAELGCNEQNMCISEDGETALCVDEIISLILKNCDPSS